MRKGFIRKPKPDEPATPLKNYITPSGLERLKDEHRFLLTRERPAVTEVVAWAASNGLVTTVCSAPQRISLFSIQFCSPIRRDDVP
jgi:hypothetical protein